MINASPPTPPVQRERIGAYELIAQLDARADAIIYLAIDSATGRIVELRRPRDGVEWVKRAQVAQLVDHPAARAVLHYVPEEPGGFFALEYPAGEPLEDWLAGSPPPPITLRLRFLVDVADLAIECHRLGLVIGSLDPSSIGMREPGAPLIDISGVGAPERAACAPSDVTLSRSLTPESDVLSLGSLIAFVLAAPASSPKSVAQCLLGDAKPPSPDAVNGLMGLLDACQSDDPEFRPTAARLRDGLIAVLNDVSSNVVDDEPRTALHTAVLPSSRQHRIQQPVRFGRFAIVERLGQGGMGSVYKARDEADDSLVALKVMSEEFSTSPDAVRRFRKEARLLAQCDSTRIARLLEVNEEDGVPYLVMELVGGDNLASYLRRKGALPEDRALDLIAQIAEGLAIAHDRGIVHRDIKPSNVMVQATGPDAAPTIKLLDFGLARELVQSQSMDMTRTGAMLGTPTYMAPEQCSGKRDIGPSADVYALGVMLYELLAGTPPFVGNEALKVAAMHCLEPPPPLASRAPRVSDGTARIVETCLSKQPSARFKDASEFLRAVQAVVHGEPINLQAHPILPPHDPKKIFAVDWSWDLRARPEQLWPYVSNSQRINRAAGIPSVAYERVIDPDKGVRLFGSFRLAGLAIRWEEHPFEWIEGQRTSILREFTQGPFAWFLSTVTLIPRPEGGTRLIHSVRIAPKGLVGRLVAAREVSAKGRKNLDRIYEAIDRNVLAGLATDPAADVIEPVKSLGGRGRARLDERLSRLGELSVNPTALRALGNYLTYAPAIELGRIRPIEFARRFGLDADQTIEAFLRATRLGLLELHWDILCPRCRVASDIKSSLREILEHGDCHVCGQSFDVDFANSIEMIFRVHPEIRDADLRTYCIGGPDHHPHVVAQVQLGPGERVDLELTLGAGDYAIRGPQLAHGVPVTVRVSDGRRAGEARLGDGRCEPLALLAGRQLLTLHNQGTRTLIAKLERQARRTDALTAARAASLALFRELFPDEVLAPGRLVSVASVTVMAAEFILTNGLFDSLGDAGAFGLLSQRFADTERAVRVAGGTLVRRERDRFLAVFDDPLRAANAGIEVARLAGSSTNEAPIRAAVHRGSVLVMTADDAIDYFGSSVLRATELMRQAGANEVIFSESVAEEPAVAQALADVRDNCHVMRASGNDSAGRVCLRYRRPSAPGEADGLGEVPAPIAAAN